jgi:glycerol-3-phosphate acyltransferase PlsY
MYLILGICSYLIGSIPFSYLIPKWIGKIDIRTMGSGNTGTTNVVRTLGMKVGVLAFIGDFLKGIIPALIGLLWLGELGGIIGGSMAVIGHCFPVWLKFKGGKGVATSAGILIVLMPDICLLLLIGQFIIIALTKYMSLASLLSALLLPILAFIFSKSDQMVLFSIGLALFVIVRHRANLFRLIKGTESKLVVKKKTK